MKNTTIINLCHFDIDNNYCLKISKYGIKNNFYCKEHYYLLKHFKHWKNFIYRECSKCYKNTELYFYNDNPEGPNESILLCGCEI